MIITQHSHIYIKSVLQILFFEIFFLIYFYQCQCRPYCTSKCCPDISSIMWRLSNTSYVFDNGVEAILNGALFITTTLCCCYPPRRWESLGNHFQKDTKEGSMKVVCRDSFICTTTANERCEAHHVCLTMMCRSPLEWWSSLNHCTMLLLFAPFEVRNLW
jgi:hypothetical protein